MSLGIFSFDLAALIYSLSNLVDEVEPAPVIEQSTLDKIEAVLQDIKPEETKLDDILMASALASTVTAVITAGESVKKEPPIPAPAVPATTPAPVRPAALDDETRREIERLIKSLQTSVTHNYRDADIVDEAVALKTVTNSAKREKPQTAADNAEKLREDRKKDDLKLEKLREDLRRARLKNNIEV